MLPCVFPTGPSPGGATLAGGYEPRRTILTLPTSLWIPISKLSQNELCNIGHPASRRLPHAYWSARFSPNIVDTPSLWQSVLTMIEAGEGVSIVPESVKHLRSRDVAFRPLRDRGCTIDIVLAWRASSPDAVQESFLALLRAHQAEVKRSFNQ